MLRHSVLNSTKIIRGSLTTKPELIEFFKFSDEWTAKKDKDKNKLYTVFDAKTNPDGRDYLYGFKQKAMEKFNVKSQQTITARINQFPKGITEQSKHHKGVQSVVYEKWSQTGCFEAIKQHPECWDAKKGEFTQKGKKYEAHLKEVFAITKKDPLDLNLQEWLVFWGNPSKSQNTAHPKFIDGMTLRVSYASCVSFRFAMQRSHASDIRELITAKDGRFTTDNLKRPTGLHKEEFQNEDQIKALPEFFNSTEVLMADYCGILFGGRFDALKDLTPADVKREFHVIHFYEGKVDRNVDKPIYEPETGFIWEYITYKKLAKNEKLFPHGITWYNAQLTKAGQEMAIKYPELKFLNDKNEEWTLTTHRGFKHTCVSQMALHGVRRDVISDYVGTDEATLKDFYQGGASANIDHEIGGQAVKTKDPTWRAFVYSVTEVFRKRFLALASQKL